MIDLAPQKPVKSISNEHYLSAEKFGISHENVIVINNLNMMW